MRRSDLEHIIRAASGIANNDEIVIVGSQSILGAIPDAPAEFTQSIEADVYPLNAPELADLIEGSIGELSPFHERFGYYAQGVAPGTAILPPGWQARLIRVQNANTRLMVGLCLEPHDLAASKLSAHREKDLVFVADMIRHRFVDINVLRERVQSLPIPDQAKAVALAWVDAREQPPKQPTIIDRELRKP